MPRTWPIILGAGDLTLRPLRFRDRKKWLEARFTNRAWLKSWEATSPFHSEKDLPTFYQMVRYHHKEGRAGRALTFAMWKGPELIGQITMGGIGYGALRGAHIGYWIDQRYANQGLTTKAVATLTDYGFEVLKLHRIEINIRPENGASRRVAAKAGFHEEGMRPSYLHIDGSWRDHIVFVRFNPSDK